MAKKEAEVQAEAATPKKMKNKLKRVSNAGLEDNVEEAPAVEAEVPMKKKKKVRKEAAEEAPEAPAAEEVVPKKSKKARREAAEAEADDAGAEVPEPPKKKKKKAAVEGNDEAPVEVVQAKATTEGGVGENLCKTLFIRGLPWSVDEETLRKDFGECGKIESLELMKDQYSGLPKGVAFITYEDEVGVQVALTYDGTDYGGRMLEVRRDGAKGKGKGKAKGKGGPGGQLEIFIRGLGPKTKESSLTKEFSKCGEIERLKMDVDIGDGGRCKGYAWITFTTQEGLDKALERNGTDWGNSTLAIEKSGQHRDASKGSGSKGSAGKGSAGKGGDAGGIEVFVRGLPLETEEDVVRRDFVECGEIVRINMPKGFNSACKGYAWIVFKTNEAAEKAVAFNGDDYNGSKLLVEVAGQHKTRGPAGNTKTVPGAKPTGCMSVVVKKLSYDADEDDLKKTFGKCGKGPVNIKILTDWDTGKSKGIAFVDFDSEQAVDQAIKLSGGMIKDRAFFMDYAKPREPAAPGA